MKNVKIISKPKRGPILGLPKTNKRLGDISSRYGIYTTTTVGAIYWTNLCCLRSFKTKFLALTNFLFKMGHLDFPLCVHSTATNNDDMNLYNFA